MCDEQVLEQYLAGEAVGTEQIKRLIRERKLFPMLFRICAQDAGGEGVSGGLLSGMPVSRPTGRHSARGYLRLHGMRREIA